MSVRVCDGTEPVTSAALWADSVTLYGEKSELISAACAQQQALKLGLSTLTSFQRS